MSDEIPFPASYIAAAAPFRIWMMSQSSGHPPSDYQEELRHQEQIGWLTILYMDDELAMLCYHDERMARLFEVPFVPRVTS